jgi:hypothetical protein
MARRGGAFLKVLTEPLETVERVHLNGRPVVDVHEQLKQLLSRLNVKDEKAARASAKTPLSLALPEARTFWAVFPTASCRAGTSGPTAESRACTTTK